LAVRASTAFLRSYLLRAGFLDGRDGVVVALAGAVNAVTALALASESDSQGADSKQDPVDESRTGR
jgi:hypothetical protein